MVEPDAQFAGLRVWLHWVTALQPVPVLRVHPDVCAGHDVQLVALPPALNVAPVHCEHVALSPLPLRIEPALAVNVLVAVPQADALVATFFN